jgi:hypothetical protein
MPKSQFQRQRECRRQAKTPEFFNLLSEARHRSRLVAIMKLPDRRFLRVAADANRTAGRPARRVGAKPRTGSVTRNVMETTDVPPKLLSWQWIIEGCRSASIF